MFIATYIATGRTLATADIERARALLSDLTTDIEVAWLEDGVACDIRYDVSGDRDGVALGRDLLAGCFQEYDLVVQPAAHREKRLLVADMDSTMITVECIDELADYAGVKVEVAAVTEAAMRGELDFESALDARVALLAGLPATAIDACLAERVRETPGARTLVRTMRGRGARCVLVSGGFTRFAEPVGAALGFDRVLANVLEIEGGRLTGRVARPIVGAATKLETLEAEVATLGLPREATMAVGDGANDLPMVRAAGLGVAYHAKPVVAAAAAARIDRGDLTALLYAQGIRRAEWVE